MKLIRDNLNAGDPNYEHRTVILADTELQKRLVVDKLVEEAHEVWAAFNKEHGNPTEELGDLLDVIERLQFLHGINNTALNASRATKRVLRGGFDEGKVLL